MHIYQYQTYAAIYKFIHAHTETHITHINMRNAHVLFTYTHTHTNTDTKRNVCTIIHKTLLILFFL